MINLLKSIFSDNPKVIILGFGKEGKSSYRFVRKYFPEIKLAIADVNKSITSNLLIINDKNLEVITGHDYLNSIVNYDLIIKSPGVKIISPNNELKSKITSQTDLFIQCFASQTIGITGTKGKSTTASLIKHFADADGKKAILLGNIGVPAFDMIDEIDDETIIIYELSAHQLEYIQFSPHVAVLLNVYPEHLDYFDSYKNYRNSKFNIFKHQNSNDVFIYHETFSADLHNYANEFVKKNNTVSQLLTIVSNNDYVYQIKNNPLVGNHNLINISIALAAAESVGIDTDIAINSLPSFCALPHRLEYIGEYGGIKFINDSISTIPQSAIAAVKAVKNVNTIILGGFDRGLDYSELVGFLIFSNVENFIFLGKAGDSMFNLFPSDCNKKLIKVESVEKAFDIIPNITPVGKTCLLSPAAASYDQFKNFEHRGDVFTMLAKKLGSDCKTC